MEQTFKPEANVNMLLHQFFDTMLSFAARVLGGEMPDDDATTQWAFEQIYSFVVPNVREELLISSGSSTVSKPLVALRSSASADRTQIYNSKAQKPRKISIFRGFLIPFSSDCF